MIDIPMGTVYLSCFQSSFYKDALWNVYFIDTNEY